MDTNEFRIREYGKKPEGQEVIMIDRKENGILTEGIRITKDELRTICRFVTARFPEIGCVFYDQIRRERVKSDVKAHLEENDNSKVEALGLSDEEYDRFVGTIASRYANGRYDCNLSYWDNLDNLINEAVAEWKEAV